MNVDAAGAGKGEDRGGSTDTSSCKPNLRHYNENGPVM